MSRNGPPPKFGTGRIPRDTPLRRLRLDRKLSTRQVATAAGITEAHLGNVERGVVPVGAFTAYGLARAYRMTEEEITETSERTVELFDAMQTRKPKRGGSK